MLTLIAMLLVAEPQVERWPLQLPAQRRVLEAARQARDWASHAAAKLFPWQMARYIPTFEKRLARAQLQFEAERELRKAAYRQICKAYDINEKEFLKILRDPMVRTYEFTREKLPTDPEAGRIRMATNPWFMRQTRFDPGKVRLSPKLAKRYGYRNPPEEEKVAPSPLNPLRP